MTQQQQTKGRETPPLVGPGTPNPLGVVLGGKQFTIQPRPIKATREWKAKAEPIIDELINILAMIPTNGQEIVQLVNTTQAAAGGNLMEASIGDLLPMLMKIKSKILHFDDIVLDLLYAYSPDLAAQHDFIEENAFDGEAIYALVLVLRLVFPLEQLKMAFRGEASTAILSNSQGRNGTSQKPNLTTVR